MKKAFTDFTIFGQKKKKKKEVEIRSRNLCRSPAEVLKKKNTELKVTSQSFSTNWEINISDKVFSEKGSENYGSRYY